MQTISWHLYGLTITLRNAPGTPYYVSRDGMHSVFVECPHMITTYVRSTAVKYFSCGQNSYLHRLVAQAWVYNPCPGKFKWVDHIDGDTQNNDSKNLRWVSASLNGLNKTNRLYSRKETRRYKSGKVGVFYGSSVTLHGKCKKIYRGTRDACEKATKELINDRFLQSYADAVKEGSPKRPHFKTYWRDPPHTPVMRPGFLDPTVRGAPEIRSPQYII